MSDGRPSREQNQRKKLAKQAAAEKKAAAAAAGGAAASTSEVTGIDGTKTEKVKVAKDGSKTVKVDSKATVTATTADGQDVKETAKKSSSKKTTPSGLIIEDKRVGTGPAAKKGQKLKMRYIGKLQNGKVFDQK